jgi:carbamoyltransferase
MKVLGLSTMGNSAASITVNGKVIAAIEEERLTRIKNDGGFPYKSIESCLNIANFNLAEIDEIAIYWKPWNFIGRVSAVLRGLVTDPKNAKFRVKQSSQAILGVKALDNYPELRGSWLDLFKIKAILISKFGEFSAKIRFYDHHDCHAASIYYLTNFDRAICLTYDGGGESDSTVIYAINNGKFEKLKTIAWPNSLGHFYSSFTGFLGFRMLEGEYKMMGLAPYGNPRFKDIILEKILNKREDGNYHLNTKILNYHAALNGNFSSELVHLFGESRKATDEFNDHHKDIAASVQAAYEEILLHMLSWAKSKKPTYENLCIAGGCGLNVTANGKIVKNNIFNKVLIPPAPHDAGAAIGASFLAESLSGLSRDKLLMPTPYLGKSYQDGEIIKAFEDMGLQPPLRFKEDELIEIISEALTRHEVVAWFQGGSEFGPRALGARSFLADPRDESIREVLNTKIKKRELFRPFAPSCKKEVANDYFELDQESPYMNIVARVRADKQEIIPAVTHTDGTARVHTVDRDVNPLYWKLIDAFEKKTGVGVLLNTSLNIQEPIVENPTQAINCFLRSSVDWLAIGPYLCDSKWRNQVASRPS